MLGCGRIYCEYNSAENNGLVTIIIYPNPARKSSLIFLFYFFSVVNMITRKITWYVPSSYVHTLQLVCARMCYCMSQGWVWEYYAYEINVLMVVHMYVYSKHPLRVSTLLCLGQYGRYLAAGLCDLLGGVTVCSRGAWPGWLPPVWTAAAKEKRFEQRHYKITFSLQYRKV